MIIKEESVSEILLLYLRRKWQISKLGRMMVIPMMFCNQERCSVHRTYHFQRQYLGSSFPHPRKMLKCKEFRDHVIPYPTLFTKGLKLWRFFFLHNLISPPQILFPNPRSNHWIGPRRMQQDNLHTAQHNEKSCQS